MPLSAGSNGSKESLKKQKDAAYREKYWVYNIPTALWAFYNRLSNSERAEHIAYQIAGMEAEQNKKLGIRLPEIWPDDWKSLSHYFHHNDNEARELFTNVMYRVRNAILAGGRY
jgi:hypothetical protein